MTTTAGLELTAGRSPRENIPCEHCKFFTTDYQREATESSDRFNFILPYHREESLPGCPGLQASSAAGCQLCHALLAALLEGEKRRRGGPPYRLTKVVITAKFVPFYLEPWSINSVVFHGEYIRESGEVWHAGHLKSFFPTAPTEEHPKGIFSKARDHEALSLENVRRIKRWISNCEDSHEFCLGPDLQLLPTRVIDVSLQDPCLINSKGQEGQYLALSHCWGLSEQNPYEVQYMLTLKTLPEMEKGILFEVLPKTFQDAVTTTRTLGFRYLWIDSICIIQDSPSDTEHEVHHMASIYANASLTICATNSVNSQSGFLAREPLLEPVAVAVMPLHSANGDLKGEYSLYDSPSEILGEYWHWDVEPTEWNKRAWTFQERLVSSRILHFGERLLYFECRTTETSEFECPPRPTSYLDEFSLAGGGTHTRYLGCFEYLGRQNPPERARIYGTYYSMAKVYSSRDLSYMGDKESAFLAIVSRFQLLLKSEHIYGIWWDDLMRGLAWRPNRGPRVPIERRRQFLDLDRENRMEKRQKEMAILKSKWPTWSWYSCPDEVDWRNSRRVKEVDPPSERSFPQPSSKPTNPFELEICSVIIEVDVRWMLDAPMSDGNILVCGKTYGSLVYDVVVENDQDTVPVCLPQRVWILRLGKPASMYKSGIKGTISGLIIEPVGKDNVYRRVGVFFIDRREDWVTLLQDQVETTVTLI